jgi:hypothetical protein
MYKTLSIIILILICIFLSAIYNQFNYYMIDKTSYELTDIKDIKYRTGDIIFHKWNTNILTYDNFNKQTNVNLNIFDNFFQSGFLMNFSPKYYPYIHVAIVVIIDGVPYMYQLSEFTEDEYKYCYNTHDKDTILNFPVLLDMEYVNYYRGHMHHFSYTGNSISDDVVKKIIRKNKNVKKSTLAYMNGLIDKKYKNDQKHMCVSFISKVLEEMGIHKFKNYYSNTTGTMFNEVILNGDTYEKTPSILDNPYMNYRQ